MPASSRSSQSCPDVNKHTDYHNTLGYMLNRYTLDTKDAGRTVCGAGGPEGVGGNLLLLDICQPVTFVEHLYRTQSCSRFYISGCRSCFSWLYEQRVCVQGRIREIRNRKLESWVVIGFHSVNGAISFPGGDYFRKRDCLKKGKLCNALKRTLQTEMQNVMYASYPFCSSAPIRSYPLSSLVYGDF